MSQEPDQGETGNEGYTRRFECETDSATITSSLYRPTPSTDSEPTARFYSKSPLPITNEQKQPTPRPAPLFPDSSHMKSGTEKPRDRPQTQASRTLADLVLSSRLLASTDPCLDHHRVFLCRIINEQDEELLIRTLRNLNYLLYNGLREPASDDPIFIECFDNLQLFESRKSVFFYIHIHLGWVVNVGPLIPEMPRWNKLEVDESMGERLLPGHAQQLDRTWTGSVKYGMSKQELAERLKSREANRMMGESCLEKVVVRGARTEDDRDERKSKVVQEDDNDYHDSAPQIACEPEEWRERNKTNNPQSRNHKDETSSNNGHLIAQIRRRLETEFKRRKSNNRQGEENRDGDKKNSDIQGDQNTPNDEHHVQVYEKHIDLIMRDVQHGIHSLHVSNNENDTEEVDMDDGNDLVDTDTDNRIDSIHLDTDMQIDTYYGSISQFKETDSSLQSTRKRKRKWKRRDSERRKGRKRD
ncbi:hypothetical protein B0J11DRAFT_583347 [Dendryphion nanum]|uniref:Uncharacterized protein n=1 Tax=Dendryphion nanum TaxID=256645 RepID=A0A9P9DFU2_9PLEO|nr:hypothetical protein B0J11DRAFT_583347 [Dendryphion nanum]